MGSYFGDQPNNMANDQRCGGFSSNSSSSSSSNSSAKKGKNKSSSDKPRQPQRGLGVAQLEKIRLHTQMATVFPNPPYQHMIQEETRIQAGYQVALQSPYGYHPKFVMEIGDPLEKTTNIGYSESQSYRPTPRWNPNNVIIGVPESQPCTQQPGMVTRHLIRSHVEQNNRRNAQSSDPNDKDELDLELKLSI